MWPLLIHSPHHVQWRQLDGGDASSSTSSSSVGDAHPLVENDGTWIVFAFLIFSGWVLLAFSTAVGLYASKENRLMRKYEEEGVFVAGDIVRMELIRGGFDAKKDADTAQEYLVAVQYDTQLDPEYTTRISKWIRVRGDDLPRRLVQKSPLIGSVIEQQTTAELQDMARENDAPEERRHDAMLDLLVLPGFPCSGYARATVSRARSLGSRLVSFAYVSFGVILNVALLCMAVYSICDGVDDSAASPGASSRRLSLIVGCLSAELVSVLLLTQVRVISDPISNFLTSEFLKGGEFISRPGTIASSLDPYELHCRTISSRNDVFLLATTKQAAYDLQ